MKAIVVLVVVLLLLAGCSGEEAEEPIEEAAEAPEPDGPPPTAFLGRVGPTSEVLRRKRERFFEWLKSVDCKSAPYEWRDEGVAGETVFLLRSATSGSELSQQAVDCLRSRTFPGVQWAPFRSTRPSRLRLSPLSAGKQRRQQQGLK